LIEDEDDVGQPGRRSMRKRRRKIGGFLHCLPALASGG